jgi:cell division septal protein FtsQ
LRFSLRQFVRALSVSFAVAVLTAATVYIASGLIFPVKGVRVTGNKVLSAAQIRRQIPDHSSLITLNSGLLVRRLESDPWVKRVRVSKDWGSGIVTVEVEERRAVLEANLGGRKVFVSADGTKLPGSGGADLHPVDLEGYQLEEIVRDTRLLQENGLALESIDRVDSGGVHATVDGRRVVFSGTVDTAQARALRGIMRRNPKAQVFDLRSPHRVVVGSAKGSGQNG